MENLNPKFFTGRGVQSFQRRSCCLIDLDIHSYSSEGEIESPEFSQWEPHFWDSFVFKLCA